MVQEAEIYIIKNSIFPLSKRVFFFLVVSVLQEECRRAAGVRLGATVRLKRLRVAALQKPQKG